MVRHYELGHDAAVQVASIERGGPASRAGFEQGDIIVEFAGRPVAGFDDLHRLLTEERLGERVSVTVLRRGRRVTLETALDEAR
jgi:S1-C subfamily serine protease